MKKLLVLLVGLFLVSCSDRTMTATVNAVDGYSDVSAKTSGKSATLKVDRQLGVGLQYQRQLGERIYLGGEIDSNQGVGALLGFSF